MDTLGDRIRQGREAQGWIPRIRAYEETGISPDSWANWETGRATPHPDTLRELCVHLQVTADWLLGLS